MAQGILLVVILFIINHFAVGLIRAEIRLQHIKKYQYDYYEQRPKAVNNKLWYNFKSVIFKGRTIVISVILSAVVIYLLSS